MGSLIQIGCRYQHLFPLSCSLVLSTMSPPLTFLLMMASMMSYTKAAPERTKRAPGDSDYCDHFAEFYLKHLDKMYMQFGSDGPNECRKTYYGKRQGRKRRNLIAQRCCQQRSFALSIVLTSWHTG